MKILYLDCTSGISGDMFLGALIDCGLKLNHLSWQLSKMRIGRYTLKARRVKRGGITGIKFDVLYGRHNGRGHTREKTLKHIVKAIRDSTLPLRVKERSIAVFTNLANAESRAHGITPDKIHFHEVGDIDSVVDIVGACIGMEYLAIDEVFTSRIVSGTGTVSVHGAVLPNPAPATAYLLRGLDVSIEDIPYEMVTPTGAAILKAFSERRDRLPALAILKVGYGAGRLEIPGRANLLRAMVCERADKYAGDTVTLLETNIDDMNPQVYGLLVEELLKKGALDAYLTPVIMKKSRPGCVLTVVCEPNDADAFSEIIFRETPTFGIRYKTSERKKLDRKIVEVMTKYGKIRVKLGFFKGKLKTISPEYDDCVKAAELKGAAFMDIRREAESVVRRAKGEKVRL